MKNNQFTLITHDFKCSICIDFKKFSIDEIKDIIIDMDDIAKLTIRIPFETEYSVIKDLLSIEGMTSEKMMRITLDFVS
ncbi:MAG TPA: hypothetical protein PKN54_06630 [Candidatus Cloacimonas acidaminovorans]|nr:hypothetical protein [Bacteroidales bacterium]HNV62612.1 hypothetical protein [Candidatus Cloacimonas acidaminovorans]